jgi:hypothetical protein
MSITIKKTDFPIIENEKWLNYSFCNSWNFHLLFEIKNVISTNLNQIKNCFLYQHSQKQIISTMSSISMNLKDGGGFSTNIDRIWKYRTYL